MITAARARGACCAAFTVWLAWRSSRRTVLRFCSLNLPAVADVLRASLSASPLKNSVFSPSAALAKLIAATLQRASSDAVLALFLAAVFAFCLPTYLSLYLLPARRHHRSLLGVLGGRATLTGGDGMV